MKKDLKTSPTLLNAIKYYCRSSMEHGRCSNLPYHNWDHTKDVVSNCLFIGRNLALNMNEMEELIIAAYFHDLGQMKTSIGHEALSSYYAGVFLNQYHYDENSIRAIQAIIAATKMPQCPHTKLQDIICDADLAHLGQPIFFEKNKQLRAEIEILHQKRYEDTKWAEMNIKFLRGHEFHTAFAREYFGPQKIKNLEALERVVADS